MGTSDSYWRLKRIEVDHDTQAQRFAVMKLRPGPSSVADLQHIFGALVGTLDAAPLLAAAHKLRLRAGVEEAIRAELYEAPARSLVSTTCGTVTKQKIE